MPLGSNADLLGLTLASVELDQSFQADQPDYTASVGYAISLTQVTLESEDANASISINGNNTGNSLYTSDWSLEEGLNTLTILVTAEDGSTTKTYTVEVTRDTASEFVQQAYLKASNAEESDGLGWYGLAISGDTLAVGAPFEDSSANGGEEDDSELSSGAVYIFTRTNGVWTQQAYLKASNAELSDNFGFYLALDGDVLAVGAHQEDSSALGGQTDNSKENSGAVYIFRRANSVWAQEAYLKASDAETEAYFGRSLALNGNTLVVGAIGADNFAGAAYVFSYENNVWGEQDILKGSNTEEGDYFGISVALTDDTLAIGADSESSSFAGGENDNSENWAGAVYVFGLVNGEWVQNAFIKASNAEEEDLFGFAIALSGDTLAVGAFWEDSSTDGGESDNSQFNSGAAYIYQRNGATWTQEAFIKAPEADSQDYFGMSVALLGNTLAVGSIYKYRSEDEISEPPFVVTTGVAYVYSKNNSGQWLESRVLKSSNAEHGDDFGFAMAFSGDTLAITAPHEDSSFAGGEEDNSEESSGAVYVFQ